MGDRQRNQPRRAGIDLESESAAMADTVAEVVGGGAPVVVRRDGVPVAAIVSLADLTRWRRHDRESTELKEALERISDAFSDMPLDELEARVAETVQQVREDLRRKAAARRSA